MGKIDLEGINFLKACIRINPAERITAYEGLRHPYFAELHEDVSGTRPQTSINLVRAIDRNDGPSGARTGRSMAPQTRAGGKRNNKKFVGKNTKSSSPQPYGKAFSKPVVKPGLRVPKKNQTVLHEDYEYGDMVRQRSKDNLSKSNYSSVYDNSFRYAKKKKPKM